jgi:hypothetical protein
VPSRRSPDHAGAKLDSYRDTPFMPEGREQPPMPVDDRKYFDD